jgi:hypothetical protein
MKRISSALLASLFTFNAAASACNVPEGRSLSTLIDPSYERIDASSSPLAGEPSLAEVRKATLRFRDVKVAEAEGYIRDPANMCETAEMMGLPKAAGAMGIHYFRPDMLGVSAPPNPRVDGNGTHANFSNPAVLIYEPQASGALELVAVENLVFAKAWADAGNTELPTFHGKPFDRMADNPATELDEAHNFMPHYDRHIWLYRENPNGIFTPFNPNVTCEHHGHQNAHKG